MKPINPLKSALKGFKLERVESSDVIWKPIDSTARRVVMPAAWWAKPIPEQRKSVAELEATAQQLQAALAEARSLVAKKDDKIKRLKAEVETLQAVVTAAKKQQLIAESDRDLMLVQLTRLNKLLGKG